MTPKTETYPLNTQLTLYENSEFSLTVRVVSLTLTKHNDQISQCHLTFQVSPETYQHINTKALFNLKPEIRTPLSNGLFQPSPDIEIEASLDPALFPQLAKHATKIHQLVDYLQKISQESPENPLLSTYSWYGLQVKQQLETGETGYRTLWHYLKPSDLTPDGISSERFSEVMVNFAQEWTDTNKSQIPQDIMAEALEEMTSVIEELTNSFSTMTENVLDEAVNEINQTIEELTQDISEITEEIIETPNIWAGMVNFFKQEDWQFQTLAGESGLSLTFRGKNGEWNCYAKAKEKEEQFIFYSVCPIQVPKAKRRALSEFITRANSGLIIGNFELNIDNGQILYKTSIHLKNHLFNSEIFRDLVYHNTFRMDEYLPGIKAVISGNMSPEAAILMVEAEETQISPPPPNSSPSEDLIKNQPLATSDEIKEVTLNSSIPTESDSNLPSKIVDKEKKKQEKRKTGEKRQKVSQKSESQPPSQTTTIESAIFYRLTTEEILKFDEITQLRQKYQKPMAESLLDKLKTQLKNRLGEEGDSVFSQAYTIFQTHQFDAKQVRFIRRYGELYTLIQLQIAELAAQHNLDETVGQIPQELEKMREFIKQRLEEITRYQIDVQQEIDMLKEITLLREQLALAKNKL